MSIKQQEMLFKLGFIFLTLLSAQGLRVEDKIVGGIVSRISQAPYQVSLHINGRHVCGGSIIGHNYVLTAAHCVYKQLSRKMSVSAGGTFYSVPLKKLPVGRYAIHPGYNETTSDNDIAIIKAISKFVFGPRILPIALPNENEEIPDGTMAIVTGWGYEHETGTFLSPRLRKVEVPKINHTFCQELYGDVKITDNMLCAGFKDGGRDACQGDSGGPFVAKGKLHGITSWGIGCARGEYPGVYTKVSKYRQWIKLYTSI